MARRVRAAARLADRDGGGIAGVGEPSADNFYTIRRRAATEDAGLRAWAARRATRLADEVVQHDTCEADAGAFFETACERERLLAVLRSAAEPAFKARLLELEGRSR